MRNFLGKQIIGPFIIFPSEFDGEGDDEIIIHAHAHDHLTELERGWYRIEIGNESKEIRVQSIERILIPAKIEHRIICLGRYYDGLYPTNSFEPNPKVTCIFSRYDEYGQFLPEPLLSHNPE
jgi:hypothetical protein